MASSFLPAKLNFPIWKAATFRYQFQWLDDIEGKKTPHNLTGYTGKAVLLGDDETNLELTDGNGGIIFGGVNGTIELHITEAQTAAFAWRKATYTLYVKEAAGENQPVLTGQFHIAGPPL